MKVTEKIDRAITETIVRLAAFGLRFAAKRYRRNGRRSRELAISILTLTQPPPAEIFQLSKGVSSLLIKAEQLQNTADDLLCVEHDRSLSGSGVRAILLVPKERAGKVIRSGADVIWRSMMSTPGFRWAKAELLASEVWNAMAAAASDCLCGGTELRSD